MNTARKPFMLRLNTKEEKLLRDATAFFKRMLPRATRSDVMRFALERLANAIESGDLASSINDLLGGKK